MTSPATTSSKVLTPSALELLPDPGTSPRCAEYTEALAVDPCGSAIDAAVVLVVETPLPWPKPVFGHPLLAGVDGTPSTTVGMARVLGAVPASDDTVGRVHAWWRDPSNGAVIRSAVLRVASNTELLALLAELKTDSPSESIFLTDQTPPERAVLICTQGSHDICCGTEGTRLAVEAEYRLDDVAVFRVSHTGGHRFAPTAMTLPDGRMWAYLTLTDLQGILRQAVSPADLAPQCRGWWGAYRGPAQLAERAVFAEVGWRADDELRHVRLEQSHDASWDFEVTCGGGTWDVTISAGRQIPTIACRTLGGMPAKPSIEYRVTSGPTRRPPKTT